jgi:hypothetical protein
MAVGSRNRDVPNWRFLVSDRILYQQDKRAAAKPAPARVRSVLRRRSRGEHHAATVPDKRKYHSLSSLSPFQMPEKRFIGQTCPHANIPPLWQLNSIIIAPTDTAGNERIKHCCSDVSHEEASFLHTSDVRSQNK